MIARSFGRLSNPDAAIFATMSVKGNLQRQPIRRLARKSPPRLPVRRRIERYDAPYYFIHRADLIDALVDAVRRHPKLTLRMHTLVAAYDSVVPAVTAAGERLTADLVICDGIKSAMRGAINGRPVEPVDTGGVAYRILERICFPARRLELRKRILSNAHSQILLQTPLL
ncbi:hypothetical protein DFH08DRAFT_944224 [Mycena albidolilacea]|uniref:Uncharacterized protein n=1 Tax=Mycena albidolilacea TaxID=1033008 RepID=A0AAD6Z5W9_9AGAR|nr:hypothetical protein DFH08DRAFT_944224 [Mycena albidolilacea]